MLNTSAQVLDACCGSKMFWFDHSDSRALFVDKRRATLVADSRQGRRHVVVAPDIVANFTHFPFPNDRFACVIFDPPHLTRNGANSWMAKKYGTLRGDWREELRKGFSECFRVLKPAGILVFKWSEDEISVAEILTLTPVKPLVGNRYGKHLKAHWIVFIKPEVVKA